MSQGFTGFYPLPWTVGNGGTGVSTLTAHAVLIGNGTSPITQLAPGTAGQLLVAQGASADPAYKTVSGDGSLSGGGVLTVSATLGVNAQLQTSYAAMVRQNDALIQCKAISATTAAQPGSPSDGDVYLLPAGSTGAAWAGNDGKIARYSTVAAAWELYTPQNGWRIFAQDTTITWARVGGAWQMSAANPTALVGLSAVNGSSISFMRADAAPALDQSITPTWTGIHTWTLSNTATSSTVSTLAGSNTANPASSSSATYRFFRGQLLTQSGNAQNFTSSFQSMYFSIDHQGTGLISIGINFYSRPTATSTGGYTDLYGFRSDFAATAASSTTTLHHFYCTNAALSGGAAMTTQVAFHSAALTAAGTNYLLKGDGGGIVSVGDTTDTTAANTGSVQTQGGAYVAKTLWAAGMANFQGGIQLKRTTVSNANTTGAATDILVVQIGSMSAAHTHTLPAASAMKAGQIMYFTDESGSVTGTNTWSITRAGADTVEGGTAIVINAAYGHCALMCDGSSKWTRISS